MTQKTGNEKYYLKAPGGKLVEVLEVYESFTGWYWYIVKRIDQDVYYGFVQGFEEEWGDIYMPEIRELMTKNKIWSVPKKNWSWTGRNTPMIAG